MPCDVLPQYDLARSPRPARLLIVSNKSVSRRPDRVFSPRDGATIATALQKVLDIQSKDRDFCIDQPREEIHKLFQREAQKKELEDYGMLIVVLMSYGYTGHIYGKDNKAVVVDHLMEYFRGSNCPAMIGKPKLFIVQACEGEMYQKKGPTECDAAGKPEEKSCCIPSEADFLIVWSPVPGNVRWRDPKTRCSPFIDAICGALDNNRGMEISRLMTRVIQTVCVELEQNAEEEFKEGGCSLPYMVHMLTKELYFHTITSSIEK